MTSKKLVEKATDEDGWISMKYLKTQSQKRTLKYWMEGAQNKTFTKPIYPKSANKNLKQVSLKSFFPRKTEENCEVKRKKPKTESQNISEEKKGDGPQIIEDEIEKERKELENTPKRDNKLQTANVVEETQGGEQLDITTKAEEHEEALIDTGETLGSCSYNLIDLDDNLTMKFCEDSEGNPIFDRFTQRQTSTNDHVKDEKYLAFEDGIRERTLYQSTQIFP